MAHNEKIKALLDKYWEGETTIDEELTLADYFAQSDIEAELLVYQPMFRYFDEEKDIATRATFEDQLMHRINSPVSVAERPVRRLSWQTIMRTAAGVALIISTLLVIDWYQNKPQKMDLYTDTYESPEAALAGLKSALIQVSDQMNGSSEMVLEQFKQFDDTQTLSF